MLRPRIPHSMSARLLRSSSSTATVGRNWSDIHFQQRPTADAHSSLRELMERDEHVRNTLAYCLSFSADDSDFSRNLNQLDALMEGQLAHCKQQQQKTRRRQPKSPIVPKPVCSHSVRIDDRPLPRTWYEIDIAHDRAIVVTERKPPFRIVSVNAAWERLCGYKLCQARHRTLGSLLHGPATDTAAGTGLIAQLLLSEGDSNEAAVTLTNYKASGEEFRNRVRVGCMEDQYFVGVLQQVNDGM